jgi:hypothetical protein
MQYYNTLPSAREAARLLGGEAKGQRILCPGPGHSKWDRSLSVKLDPAAPDGFIVDTFSGRDAGDWRRLKDYVRERLGRGDWRQQPRTKPAQPRRDVRPNLTLQSPDEGAARRIELALHIWREAVPIQGTAAEAYLRSRGLQLDEDISHALRYHPALNRDGALCAGMVARFRDAVTNAPCGIHRTFLDTAGRPFIRNGHKDKRMLGRTKGAAIKLDANADVSTGLHIGEGIETCLAARQLGLRPAWALGSAGAIADFPVLAGIEALTVFTENDEASARAADAVCESYEAAGIEAWTIEPPAGDMNDTIREAVA